MKTPFLFRLSYYRNLRFQLNMKQIKGEYFLSIMHTFFKAKMTDHMANVSENCGTVQHGAI